MPKRKKFPRLPNAYGSVRYLGKRRTNCYAVHPPCTEINELGDYVRPKAICYVDDWYVGFAVLNAWHAGTYKPGDELLFKSYRAVSGADLDAFCARLLTDFSAHSHVEEVRKEKELTFAQVYEVWHEWKFGENAKKELSESAKNSTRAAFKNSSALHDRIFTDIRLDDLQKCIDDCPLRSASVENMKSLYSQMYKYAILHEICDKNYSTGIILPEEDDEHGVPFTDAELKILWHHRVDPTVEMMLIMCYSGYRISAYKNMVVNMTDWYFHGGVKTRAGKERTVPIHSVIQPLVSGRIERLGKILPMSTVKFRNSMYSTLESLGIEKHTPHDCRHTFSRLCEKYKVSENDRKRMMGHSFKEDITNKIYGHRTLEELREEIEKIEAPI